MVIKIVITFFPTCIEKALFWMNLHHPFSLHINAEMAFTF